MPEPKVNDIRILTAINLVNSKFDQNFDFNDLAESLNLSASRLRYLFKEQTGISFRKYLRLVRMKQAKHLLETTFLTVNETARMVGITDASHFVRDFEKEFGLSPDRYRKQDHSAQKTRLPTHKSEQKTETIEMANK
jgi:transcriptional regulator GlxA family with amidase domain